MHYQARWQTCLPALALTQHGMHLAVQAFNAACNLCAHAACIAVHLAFLSPQRRPLIPSSAASYGCYPDRTQLACAAAWCCCQQRDANPGPNRCRAWPGQTPIIKRQKSLKKVSRHFSGGARCLARPCVVQTLSSDCTCKHSSERCCTALAQGCQVQHVIT